jgi:hypothetical protein
MRKLIFGRKYGTNYLYPVNGSTDIALYFSTRTDNLTINWGDGSSSLYTTSKNIDFTISSGTDLKKGYSSAFVGNVSIISPKKDDIYSLRIQPKTTDKLNILDFESFINQFQNLYSLVISNELISDFQRATLKGDLSKIPNSLERFQIEYIGGYYNNATDFYLNISNFSTQSKLKWFNRPNLNNYWTRTLTVYGDLSKLPPQIQYFNLEINSNTVFTYTSGKVWESSFDTLNLGNGSLSVTDTDNLLIDLNNSITTAIGSKIINLANCYRTSLSDSAVVSLQAKGYTVTVLGVVKKLIDLGFQNNFNDLTGVNTLVSGNGSNFPTFVSGRKGTDFAANFNGSQSIKTSSNFIINNDKVSISFWMKTSNNAVSFITELSNPSDNKNAFYLATITNTQLRFGDRTPDNIRDITINSGSWQHIVIVVDRSLDASNSTKIYKNSIRQTETIIANNNTSGTYINDILYIGQRGGNSAGFIGQIQEFKMFNYALTQTEIDNLYNE